MTCRMMIDDLMMSWFNHCQIVKNDSKYGFLKETIVYLCTIYLCFPILLWQHHLHHDWNLHMTQLKLKPETWTIKSVSHSVNFYFAFAHSLFRPLLITKSILASHPFHDLFQAGWWFDFYSLASRKGRKIPHVATNRYLVPEYFVSGYITCPREWYFIQWSVATFFLIYGDNTVVLISDFH